MDFKKMCEVIKITDAKPVKIDGQVFSADYVTSTLYARIWRSAMVVKNKREADKGGIKTIVSQALDAGLIKAEDALSIILTGDKAKVAELKAKLPEVAKSEEPSDDDVAKAITQVLSNSGQR